MRITPGMAGESPEQRSAKGGAKRAKILPQVNDEYVTLTGAMLKEVML